jgi:hypothetical protein
MGDTLAIAFTKIFWVVHLLTTPTGGRPPPIYEIIRVPSLMLFQTNSLLTNRTVFRITVPLGASVGEMMTDLG